MHSSSVRLVTWEGYLRCGGSVVLHKRDGRQLLAELFQHDHALQQGDVVHPGWDKRQHVNHSSSPSVWVDFL